MDFDSFSSYFSYVDLWCRDARVSGEAAFIYLRWRFDENGPEALESDLRENGVGRTALELGDITYYYLLIDRQGGAESIYDVEWLYDGYLFNMNIPEDCVSAGGALEEELLLKYTELIKAII